MESLREPCVAARQLQRRRPPSRRRRRIRLDPARRRKSETPHAARNRSAAPRIGTHEARSPACFKCREGSGYSLLSEQSMLVVSAPTYSLKVASSFQSEPGLTRWKFSVLSTLDLVISCDETVHFSTFYTVSPPRREPMARLAYGCHLIVWRKKAKKPRSC
jgi:hypothetical protein